MKKNTTRNKLLLCLTTALAFGSIVVQADENDHTIRLNTFAYVKHFDDSIRRNGKELNETPNLIGVSYVRPYEDFNAQVSYDTFENSIYKRTHMVTITAETKGTCGLGAGTAVFLSGYSIPVIPNVYGYCTGGLLRTDVSIIPSIPSLNIDGSVVARLGLTIYEW